MKYNEQFVINKIVIRDTCDRKFLKNLSPGSYELSKGLLPNFFGNNISVSAIVGKNGCGKTSLLDIICRMSNNVAAFINRGEHRFFIEGLEADIYYSIYETTKKESKDCILQCRKRSIGLVFGDTKVKLEINHNSEFEEYIDYSNRIDGLKRILSSNFYYTIVNNYSIFAHMASEYSNETVLSYNCRNHKWEKNFANNWIDSYRIKLASVDSPITYIPHRHFGNINSSAIFTDSKLALENILLTFKCKEISILNRIKKEESPEEKEKKLKEIPYYLKNYHFERIEYTIDENKFMQFLYEIESDKLYISQNTKSKVSHIKLLVKKVKEGYKDENNLLSVILKTNNIPNASFNNDFLWMLRIYYTCCVFWCAHSRLLTLDFFDKLQNNDGILFASLNPNQKLKVARKIKAAMKDSFYDFTEIQRCHTYFENESNIENCKIEKFTDEDYLKWQNKSIKNNYFFIINKIPPTLFSRRIIFTKKEGTITTECSYETLSSGEKQFLTTTSTLAEQIVSERRMSNSYRYSYMNIILDEIELCFHPEYQRTFLYNLTYLLGQLNLNSGIHINIILTTHSPFILSDIPQNNILYLENGHIPKYIEKIRNPFASNINDILHQSFFLDKGMMGEIAKTKILSLITFLGIFDTKENKLFDHELPINLINHVGDKFLKSKLIELLNNFYKNHPALLEEKEKLSKDSQLDKDEIEKKISLLEKELEYLKKQQQE